MDAGPEPQENPKLNREAVSIVPHASENSDG